MRQNKLRFLVSLLIIILLIPVTGFCQGWNVELIGCISCWDDAIAVACQESYAYVCTGQSGLRIVNFSNPLMPFEAGYIDTPGSAHGLDVVGDYTYFADWNYLEIFDCSQAIGGMSQVLKVQFRATSQ